MNILFWIIFGALTGLVSNYLESRSTSESLLGTMILGILGALLGGFLGSMVLRVGIHGFNLASFLIAISGSFLILFIRGSFAKR